ncbi:hypothetical protein ACFLTE_12365 [Bacteroidota bacterium]
MKRLSLIVGFLTIVLGYGFSQSDTLNTQLGENEVEKIRKAIDTTTLETKNKIIIFTEYENGLTIDRIDIKTGEKKRVLDIDSDDCEPAYNPNKFRGHWSGFEVGLNDFVNNDFSMQRPAGYEYMDLKTGRSWNFSFNFMQNSVPIINNQVGLVGGFGIEMNRYYFENKNNIQLNDVTNNVEERLLVDDYNVRKSKLNSTYLVMPALLEFQIPAKGNLFYISGGVVGGLRLSNSIKVVHEINGKKQKFREKNADLNFNKWRLGLTVRFGSKDKQNNSSGFYATYYLTPLFEKGTGPELHPFAVGFRLDM